MLVYHFKKALILLAFMQSKMTLFNPTVAQYHSAVQKDSTIQPVREGGCRLCMLNHKEMSTRDNRSDVTGNEGDLTQCYCEAWAFFSSITLLYGTFSSLPSLPLVDSLRLRGARNRAFRKSARSTRACSVPEESASLAQWIPDKDNLLQLLLRMERLLRGEATRTRSY